VYDINKNCTQYEQIIVDAREYLAPSKPKLYAEKSRDSRVREATTNLMRLFLYTLEKLFVYKNAGRRVLKMDTIGQGAESGTLDIPTPKLNHYRAPGSIVKP
jgi:hypothetical protein